MIDMARKSRGLFIVVAQVHSSSLPDVIQLFKDRLNALRWRVHEQTFRYPIYVDCIDDCVTVGTAMHESARSPLDYIVIDTSPTMTVTPLESCLLSDFGKENYAISWALTSRMWPLDNNPCKVTPKMHSLEEYANYMYYLHRKSDKSGIITGTGVYVRDSPAPPV